MASGEGKVVIVTGANSGIGYAASSVLCAQGYEVIVACRSAEKGEQAIENIVKETPTAKATFMQLDLAELSSVHSFVKTFHESGKPLDVLVNNAGLAQDFKSTNRQLTKDGFELTVATNHLGHFLLTNLLLDDLKTRAKETGNARIVVVASSLHDAKNGMKGRVVQPTSLENLMLEQENTYNGYQAYKNSKLANVMFTYELARRLEGTGVTVNCLCPGFIPGTNLSRDNSAVTRFMLRYVLRPMFWALNITRTVAQGGQAIVHLVTDPDIKDVTGKFFQDQKESISSQESHNEEFQRELWALSARCCKLEV